MLQHPESSFNKNHQRFNMLLDELETLCVNVNIPKGMMEHIQYFCGENGTIEDLKVRNDERIILYRKIASLLCAYIKIADQFESAGCTAQYIKYVDMRIDFYAMLRELVRCNVQLIHLVPGLILYDTTISIFDNYLYLIKKIQKEEHSPQGIQYINSRLEHYIKLREIISFNGRCQII